MDKQAIVVKNSRQFAQATQKHCEAGLHIDAGITKNKLRSVDYVRTNMLGTLDYTIRIGSTPIILYFDLYLFTNLAKSHYDSRTILNKYRYEHLFIKGIPPTPPPISMLGTSCM